jgi:hypothetical protein
MAEGDTVNVHLANGHVVIEVGAAGSEPQRSKLTPAEARELGNALLDAADQSESK